MGKFSINLTLFKTVWLGLGMVWIVALLIVGGIAFGPDFVKPADAASSRARGATKPSVLPTAPLERGIYRLQQQPLVPLTAGGAATLATIGVFGFFSYARRRQIAAGVAAQRNARTYLITLARDEMVSVEQMATAWANLHTALASPSFHNWLGRGTHVIVSYVGGGGKARLGCYVTVVGGGAAREKFVLDRLISLNGTMQVKRVPNPLPEGKMQYTELRLARPSYLAIRTDFDKNADPLATLMRLLLPSDGVTMVGVDFLLRPAEGSSWAAAGRKEREKHKEVEAKRRDQREIRELNTKLDDDRNGFDCRIRVYGSGDEQAVKSRICTIARDYFGAFKAANWFVGRPVRAGNPGLGYPVTFEDSSVLSPVELAAVCHLASATYAPELAASGARYIDPPRGNPPQGIVSGSIPINGKGEVIGQPHHTATPPPTRAYDWQKPIPLGWIENSDGTASLVSITRQNLKRHGWGVGPTGVGKSYFIALNALYHIYDNDSSVVVIEPHGELCYDIAARIHPADFRRVVIIDPPVIHGYGRTMTFNPLHLPRPDMANEVLDKNVGIFRAIAGQNWDQAPQMQQLIKMSFATLLTAAQGANYMTMYRFISDENFQQQLAALVRNPILRRYWGEIYPAIPVAERAKMIKPVITRLNNVLVNEHAGDMLGSPISTFDTAQLINTNHVILATVAGAGKDGEGSEAANTLARLIFMEVFAAAMKRVRDFPDAADRPATWMFADEAQAVLGGAAGVAQRVISESRKGNLASFYFNQVPSQLDPDTLDILTGQAGINIVWTAQTDKIAKQLAEQSLGRQASSYDVLNLPRYQTYVRAEVQGEKKVFSMAALKMFDVPKWAHASADITAGYDAAAKAVKAEDIINGRIQPNIRLYPPVGGMAETIARRKDVAAILVESVASEVGAWLEAKRRTVRAHSDKDAGEAARRADALYDKAMAQLVDLDEPTFAAVQELVAARDEWLADWIERNPGACENQVDALYQMSMLRHSIPYIFVRAASERPQHRGQAGKRASGDDQLE